ncbi:MAG: NAD-dependent epimerase/dehydratase family protein [Candidatus Acetothermia bacterium]|jgi:dihydroflavonol-4-reductase|nr:NAD-dependent epimerase/dehydratase family protein [Candidatus Acetothermia bacterium]MDH7505207.1 NAD-dependent epimerase/dehydratase family protein [Candidatus Acetothermia bacterium]
MKALVTGATGFIGANIVRALLERNYRVRALVRPDSNKRNLEGLEVELAVGDVRDLGSIRRALEGCSLLFHGAALYSFWVRPRSLIYEVNVEGTRNALQAALERGVERVVYTSSVAALGLPRDREPADERTPVEPETIVSDYKRSKYLAQQVALEFAKKLPVVIVNPSFPVGPYDIKPTPTGRVIVDFLNRRMPAYVETGMNVVDVEDVALGHLLAAEKGRVGECYILGGENLTMRELLALLEEITGLRAPWVRLPYYPILAASYLNAAWCALTGTVPRMTPETIRMSRHYMFYDPGKAVRELGFPQTPAREALRKAVEWFKANGYVSPRAGDRPRRPDPG